MWDVRHISDGQRGVALAAGAGLAWLAFYAAWLALTPGGERGLTVFADTAYLAPIAAATALAVVAARRAPAGLATMWRLMAASNALWLAAEVLWSVRELTAGSVPFPWWTDVGYLASYALLSVALYAAFRPRIRAVGSAELLDGVLVVGVLALLWWWIVLRPLSFDGGLASLVGLAYPSVGLVLLGTLAGLRLFPVRQGTLSMRLVWAGVACSTLADGLYTHAVVTHSYLTGDWIGLGWQAEAVFFALAAFVAARGIGCPGDWMRFRQSQALGTGALVTAALALVLALLIADGLADGLSSGLIAGTAALGALLAARLWLLARRSGHPPAITDEQGAYTPSYFWDQVGRLVARARHFGDPFALVLVEIDGVDERYDALADAQIARRLVGARREVDAVARLDPGRLGVLLASVELDEAFALGEGLRRAVAMKPVVNEAGGNAQTISAGIAVWNEGDDVSALVARARAALAAAQRFGGNQVRTRADELALFGDGPLDGARFELLAALARAADDREGRDPKHSHAVASLATQIALEMGLDGQAVSRTYLAGLLHDLGKLALPDATLEKPGPLDDDEWAIVRRHSGLGADLVEKIAAVRDAAPIVAAHHERWDGSGYPNRLAADRIPAEARIIAVADALVAMTSDRPYRSARSETSALTAIWRESGKRYDPAVVSALLALARDGRLKLESEERTAGSAAGLPLPS